MSADQQRQFPSWDAMYQHQLKCFSQLQPGTQGPHRFTPEQIQEIFSSRLQVLSINETVYQGTLDPLPRALFCILQREA